MSWAEVASAFKTSWENVFRSVEMVVEWGLAHRDLDGVASIGVDEVLWKRGYKFLTVVYQIDEGRRRLLWVGRDRTVKTLMRFFHGFGRERAAALRFVCSDMWKPYLKVIAKKAGQAIHVLDRFHIMANMNKAIDEVRAKEARALKAKGLGEVLKGARWESLAGQVIHGHESEARAVEAPARDVAEHEACSGRNTAAIISRIERQHPLAAARQRVRRTDAGARDLAVDQEPAAVGDRE